MKARYIPANAEIREFPAAAVVAYCYAHGIYAAMVVYKGRQSRPAFHMAFPSSDKRDAHLMAYIERETAIETAKRARQNAAHGLAVGDILYSTWGYEQTNVTFYQVVRVPSERSATVQQIEADIINGVHDMTGTTTPRPGAFAPQSKPETRRATGLHSLNGGERWRGDLQKWDGTPRHVTMYG